MPAPKRTAALKKRYGKEGNPKKHVRVGVLLFPRSDWATDDARAWAALQGFDTKHFEVTDTYVRILPYGKPKTKATTHNIPYGIGGIRAVVEWR